MVVFQFMKKLILDTSTDYFFIETTVEGEGADAKITKATVYYKKPEYYKNPEDGVEEIGDLQIQQSI